MSAIAAGRVKNRWASDCDGHHLGFEAALLRRAMIVFMVYLEQSGSVGEVMLTSGSKTGTNVTEKL
jgi:hypothetical protein